MKSLSELPSSIRPLVAAACGDRLGGQPVQQQPRNAAVGVADRFASLGHSSQGGSSSSDCRFSRPGRYVARVPVRQRHLHQLARHVSEVVERRAIHADALGGVEDLLCASVIGRVGFSPMVATTSR